jgi:twinkle protein
MDITEVKAGLNARVRSVAKHLLPNGVEKSHEWRVGSLDGEAGQSLGVHLSGVKAGVWADFSTGEVGDLIDLWAQSKRISLSDALHEAADWLGISRPAPAFQPKKAYSRPPKPKCTAPQGVVRDYLTETRNIPLAVLDAYKIGEQGNLIVFPFLLPDGELVLAKVREAVDGAKPKPTAKDCEPVLFGWQAISAYAREVVITEGEIDALSWSSYGYPSLSVPFGGGAGAKQQWISSEFERMERFEKIYLATDMDKQGDEAAAEIATRLGRHRCYRVAMPFKDANACLMEGVSKDAMDAAILSAKSMDPEGLRKPTEFTEAVVELFWPKPGTHVGYRTPYGKVGDKLLFRPGEMTIWTGASGMGKSQVLSDCAVDWIKQGAQVCVSSLEMKGAQTLRRMCRQTLGVEKPTEPAIRLGLRWLEQGLLLYDFIGKASVAKLLEVFSYARAKYGCDMFVVDSLMRLGIASDDNVGQEKAVYEMIEWTTQKDVHLHLVAHSRKGTVGSGAPQTEDIKGASEIGSNSPNIISIWRNKELEEILLQLEMQGQNALAEKTRAEKPGVLLNIAKQRSGDFEGKIGLWFDKSSYQYQSSYEKSSWKRCYIDAFQDKSTT